MVLHLSGHDARTLTPVYATENLEYECFGRPAVRVYQH